MYQLTPIPSIIYETESGSMISEFSSIDAWAAYQGWLAEGNLPLPCPADAAPTLEAKKEEQKDRINVSCRETIVEGFLSSALGTSHRYDSEIEDQINLIGATIAAGSGTTISYNCYDDNGTKLWHVHTPAQMLQVYVDGLMFKSIQLNKASTLKNLIDAATTIEEVETIEWQ